MVDNFIQEYVLGFAFRSFATPYEEENYLTEVLLIEKNRGHQSLIGKWNGLGGKIEPGESKEDAMVREFEEECGLQTDSDRWIPVFTFRTAYGHKIHIFSYWFEYNVRARQMESEKISWFIVNRINTTVLRNPNLKDNCKWIIPMCLDEQIQEGIITIEENI